MTKNKKALPRGDLSRDEVFREALRGFTIVEVSVAGLLMVVLGTAILGLQKVLIDTELLGFVNYTNVDEANFSLSQMAREMRTMRSGQNGAYAFIYGDNNEIR